MTFIEAIHLPQKSLRLVKFLLVGVVNTVVGISTIYSLKWYLGINDAFANVFGYSAGLTISFTLNRRWTFRHAGRSLITVTRFLIVFGVAYVINLATVLVLIHKFGINGYLSQAVGMPVYTILFYVGSRYFVFI